MEKQVKLRQYKILGIAIGSLALVFSFKDKRQLPSYCLSAATAEVVPRIEDESMSPKYRKGLTVILTL
jgi:hypothetical protein